MSVLSVVCSFVAVAMGVAVVTTAFVSVVWLADRLTAAEGIVADHIRENADVAWIRGGLPAMPRWKGWRR